MGDGVIREDKFRGGYPGFKSYQSGLSVEYPKERRSIYWNNVAFYIGITIGSIMGAYIYLEIFFPFICL